jgi:hypothetical protein
VEGYPGEGFQADEGACRVVARMSLHDLIGSGLEKEGSDWTELAGLGHRPTSVKARVGQAYSECSCAEFKISINTPAIFWVDIAKTPKLR